jgi:Holliday junction resolvase RusA-like endonuclease
MKTIQFFAAGIPKGQPRPRAFARGGHAAVYDPGTAEGWKSQVAIAAREHIPDVPLDTPIKLRLGFILPRPKAHQRANGLLKDGAPLFCAKKPDADNYAKAVMDALTLLRVWNDDCQVCELYVRKTYGPQPGCLVSITECME